MTFLKNGSIMGITNRKNNEIFTITTTKMMPDININSNDLLSKNLLHNYRLSSLSFDDIFQYMLWRRSFSISSLISELDLEDIFGDACLFDGRIHPTVSFGLVYNRQVFSILTKSKYSVLLDLVIMGAEQ